MEDLETLFRSKYLTARVFRNHAQIGKTVDALTCERLFSLYGQEVEREMMARNRGQFGFRVIDTPRVPDRKIRPRRGSGAILVAVLAFLAGWDLYIVRGNGRKKEYPQPGTIENGEAR